MSELVHADDFIGHSRFSLNGRIGFLVAAYFLDALFNRLTRVVLLKLYAGIFLRSVLSRNMLSERVHAKLLEENIVNIKIPFPVANDIDKGGVIATSNLPDGEWSPGGSAT